MIAKRISEHIVRPIVDVLFPGCHGGREIVEDLKSISQERIQHHTFGEIMNVPVPQTQEQSVAVPASSSADVGANKEFTSDDQGQSTFES